MEPYLTWTDPKTGQLYWVHPGTGEKKPLAGIQRKAYQFFKRQGLDPSVAIFLGVHLGAEAPGPRLIDWPQIFVGPKRLARLLGRK